MGLLICTKPKIPPVGVSLFLLVFKYDWSCTSASTVWLRGVDSDNYTILLFYHSKSRLFSTLLSGTFDLTACVSIRFTAPYISSGFPYVYLASNNQRM
jgi:hypothetical protein